HQPLLASYEVAEDTLGEPVSQGKGTANQKLSLMGVLCREGEPVKNPGVCAALLLPPTHLVKLSARRREIESLSAHTPRQMTSSGAGVSVTSRRGRHPPSGFGSPETIRQGGCGSNTAAAPAPLPGP